MTLGYPFINLKLIYKNIFICMELIPTIFDFTASVDKLPL